MITQVTWGTIATTNATAANIANRASTVNTIDKYEGLIIWDTTNHRLMRSEGSTDVSVWWVVDGSTSVTPS